MPYVAQPGTIQYRVWRYLLAHPEGTEFSCTQLSIELELGTARGLKSSLMSAVDGGLFAYRTPSPKVTLFRLGKGAPAPGDVQQVFHASAAATASVFAFAEQRGAASFSIAKSSDGRLTFQRHGKVVLELNQEEAAIHASFIQAHIKQRTRQRKQRRR